MGRPALLPNSIRFLSIAAAVVVALSLATPAFAIPGLGKIAKKAKDKAAEAAGVKEEAPQKEGNKVVVFDDVVLELTEARLDRIIATFNSAKAASAGRPELVEKLNKVQDERGALWEKHGESIMEMERKRGDVETCYHDGYNEIADQRGQEYQQKALTDPALREKFMQISKEYGAAAARGDTVAIKAAQAKLNAVALPTREDSLAVRKKCGPVPPPLPAEGNIAALDKQIAGYNEQIRGIDNKVGAAQAEGGGMERDQFAMAAERIQAYLSWRSSKSYSRSATSGFTDEEIDAMEKRLAKLRAALG